MSTQETELPDSQERVGLKRKLTGPPRLLLGKSKSREKLEGKSQRRQRQATSSDGTVENTEQENNDGNESTLTTHHSPEKPSEEKETQPGVPEDTSGILVTLEESESKDENMESKTKMIRSTSKTSIKRTFSSLLRCGKRKESEVTENKTLNPQKTKKNRNKAQHNMCNSTDENKLSAANKEVPNGKNKTRAFFTVWPISKRSTTSSVNLGRGYREQDNSMAPTGLTFKKIYRIFPRRKKAPPIDQFECNAPSESQTEVADQLNQSPAAALNISSIEKEENQKEEQHIKAESLPETFTFSAEVSVNTNIVSDHKDDKEIRPDQDVSLNEDENQVLKSGLDSEVLPSCCRGRTFDSEFPGTSSGGDLVVLIEKPVKHDVRCRPVITIEQAYSSEEENVNEIPQFDGLTVNGSWQHLRINSLTNNTLHPSDLNVSPEPDHSRCNETLLVQTAISMVQAAIRGAVEQLTIEQQQNQISLDHA
ncbi:hypothetical protein ROHU_003370 [Labeo rohita]|uniref:Uncharacterized protein n=1 Tax=Labeo rohita TaxID=84645 RepID=A0A498NC67_LABRO|nr:myb-like protein V [Labeo rohita]RXN26557.1 hypothetical protein ROHU_020603 [Labeo rohita]RXN35977.1 hypothetical protein ROHU_003370 [Labeo rohita]